ncbi:MAG: hypothetical protein ACYC63_03685 [Armatimonadota bacterium]
MRTQCCVACCSLPALLVIVAVVAGFVLVTSHGASPPPAWQDSPVRLQAEIWAGRQAIALEFTEIRTDGPGQDHMPCLLWTQRMDDYGRFLLLSKPGDIAAWVPAR